MLILFFEPFASKPSLMCGSALPCGAVRMTALHFPPKTELLHCQIFFIDKAEIRGYFSRRASPERCSDETDNAVTTHKTGLSAQASLLPS